jgi:CheY-like chemotaxis protein
VYRVLVIDDDQMVRELFKTALNRVHFSVDLAENGPGGIEKFNTGKFDLVITDVCMPGMDGNAVASYIKQSPFHETPVIGVSGTPWLAKHGEFDDVLLKPFSIHTLIEKAQSLAQLPKAN